MQVSINGDIGKWIVIKRIEYDVGQEELANKLGVSQPFLCMVEKGTKQPPLKMVHKLAEIFDRSIYDERSGLSAS